MATGLKVTAPATLSNLNCGFDVLGLATGIVGDEIVGRRSATPGVQIVSITGAGKTKLSHKPEENTAGVAVNHFLEYTGIRKEGIELEIHKRITPGSGLGSSASSACAAVLLANALYDNPLSLQELLPFAVLGEYVASHAYHADNVAPCLMGGIMLVRDVRALALKRINIPAGLYVTVVRPDLNISTSASRDMLSPQVPLRQMVRQSANLGALVLAFERSDLALLGDAMQDHVIEAQRAHLIPGYYAARDAAYKAGALSFGISGSGPALFGFSDNTSTAEETGLAVIQALSTYGVESEFLVTTINPTGTELQ